MTERLSLKATQAAFASHLRDARHAPPPGMDPARLQMTRQMLLDDVGGTLGECFPRCLALLGTLRWAQLIQRYLAEHRCRTPLFTEVAAEFVDWLRSASGLPHPALAELAHHEWVPVALAHLDLPAVPVTLLESEAMPVRLSPLAWLLRYHWPVHAAPLRGPADPQTMYHLLAYRDSEGHVQALLLGADAALLFQAIAAQPGLSVAQYLQRLAEVSDVGHQAPLALVRDALERGILTCAAPLPVH